MISARSLTDRIGMTRPPTLHGAALISSWIGNGDKARPVTTSYTLRKPHSSALDSIMLRFGNGWERKKPSILPDESRPSIFRSGLRQASGQHGNPGPHPMSKTDEPLSINDCHKTLSKKCRSQHSSRGTRVKFITSLAAYRSSSNWPNLLSA